MTIPLTGTGGLFAREGAIGGFLNSINTFLSNSGTPTGLVTAGNAANLINAQFQSADQIVASGLYPALSSYRGVHNTMASYLQSLAQSTIIQMANDDRPLASQTLAPAMAYLISQMVTAGASVNKPTVSASVSAASGNVGAGVIAASVLGANGAQNDYTYAETIIATCTADGQGTGTAGQETFTFASPAAEANPLAWDWPLGTGISVTGNMVDALQDNSGGNLLQNGSGKTWTNPTIGPDNWLITTGTVGTSIVQATGSNVYKGNSGFSFVGDGSTLDSISQPFGATPSTAGNSGGTSAALTPLTQYGLNLALKVSSVPAAGVLEIDLTDGNGNIVNDAAGTPNSLSISLTAATTSFVFHNTFFRTPAVIPSTGFRLRIRLTTALSAGSTLYFGHAALQKATLLYPGGLSVAQFSGNPNSILNDSYSLAVSNNYAGKFQVLFDQLFGMRAMGLQLPSSGTPTISDSLIP